MSDFSGDIIRSDQQYLIEAGCPRCGGGEVIPVTLATALKTTVEASHLSVTFRQDKQVHECAEA